METTTTTTTMQVLDLVSGETPALLLTKITNYAGGKRPFTLSLPVEDKSLFTRLCQEVERGDILEITFETEWETDTYRKRLLSFRPTPPQLTSVPV